MSGSENLPTLKSLSEALGSGRTSARQLVEESLARAEDAAGEGSRAFITLNAQSARAQADAIDLLRTANAHPGRWAGIPVSLKDLFDVRGQVTTAGSKLLAEAAVAQDDASAVRRLRQAGFIFLGRTNMTEFAYSGVGMNPHYGTPLNPYDRATGRIPGGSSSGAAVSVADRMAAAGIGTDTGGSCRIPAALCGITGYKPTARRVPRDGVYPLSHSLDSVGPLAPGVNCCAVLDDIMAGGTGTSVVPAAVDRLRIAVLTNFVTEDLEPAVSQAYERSLADLQRAGVTLTEVRFDALQNLPDVNAKGGLAAAEAYAHHRVQLEQHSGRYDPRVGGRIHKGSEQGAAEYLELLAHRRRLVTEFERLMQDYDAMLAPTVPVVAPALSAFEEDSEYVRLNLLLLRNPSIFNLLDACAISLPVHQPGDAPVGMMLAAVGGRDRHLLRAAAAVERAVISR